MPTFIYDAFALFLTSGPPPVAACGASNQYPNRTEVVNFIDESTGPVVSWAWTFGDGASSTLQNPTHSYYYDGFYSATLTVYDAQSHSSSASIGIHVQNAFPIYDITETIDDQVLISFDVQGGEI